jgi:hypothetical protein
MGDKTGGRGGLDIVIGGGARVFLDQNDVSTDPGALGDFQPRMDLNGPGSLTIKEGSTLWLDAHTNPHGSWARMDINVNIDDGTLRTTHTPAMCPPSECSAVGGRIIFGYNNNLLPNTLLHWNITNGGRIEMEGKMTWGNPNFIWDHPVDNPQTGHNPGIGMIMTINDGTLDLTGGNLYADFFGLANGELIFFYEQIGPAPGTPKNESYVINFTGTGQIIVDSGIFIVNQGDDGFHQPDSSVPDLHTPITFQRLWQLGILRANGSSGLTGSVFSDYFSVNGSPGSPNYTLTSLLAPSLEGDFNRDGVVNAADYVMWRKGAATGDYATWQTHFGESFGGAGSASDFVPESSSIAQLVALLLMSIRRRIRQ